MMARIFIEHPRQVGQTYLQHQLFAARIGGTLLMAGCAALIHAVIPALFVTTAGDAIENLHGVLQSRSEAARQPGKMPLERSYGEGSARL